MIVLTKHHVIFVAETYPRSRLYFKSQKTVPWSSISTNRSINMITKTNPFVCYYVAQNRVQKIKSKKTKPWVMKWLYFITNKNGCFDLKPVARPTFVITFFYE